MGTVMNWNDGIWSNVGRDITPPPSKDADVLVAETTAVATYTYVSTFNATTTKKKYRFKSEGERLQARLGNVYANCAVVQSTITNS
jgi:hypothetical protein